MLVSVCFFLSGAAALVLQVLWVRMLGHVFGATALAVSTTLTVFMGGLALGAYLAGKRTPMIRRPLFVFALLETAVGIYGLFVPELLDLMPAVQRAMTPEGGLGFVGYSLLRFIVVTAILIIPTTAMGATLPILAEGVVKKHTEMASRVGELYAANTAGAVVGAMLGGFVLIPKLGVSTSVYVAAAIDLLVAVTVLGLSRVVGSEEVLVRRWRAPSMNEVLREFQLTSTLETSPRARRMAVVAFGLSGAAAMALEVLWSRVVGVVIGASTYAFTLILTTFLLGLTGGAAVATRYVDHIRDPVAWLARIQVAIGVLAILGTVSVDKLPLWLHSVALERDLSLGGLYFANFAIAAVVMLPATLALGAVMPLVIRIITPDGAEHAGPIVARAYTANTVGAIAGSFLAGFVLLPLVGAQAGLAIASGTSIVVGAMLAFVSARRDRLALAGAVVAASLLFLTPRWNVSSWTAGLFRIYLARSAFADGWEPGGDLVFHEDGVATTVTVERAAGQEGVWLKVNGKVDASDIGDMPTQVLSGLLPVLVHGEPKDVLVIGCGSGVTPGAVLSMPVESVTLVEIEEAVLTASRRFFSHVNHDPWSDARFRPVVDDGRNFLLIRDDTFDVIISEPSNPWMSGASSLFTQDFFQIARRRLRKDGVFLQWLQLYELSPDNIHAILRTFQSVFPYVLVFTPKPTSNDILLIGADHPIALDRERIRAALADARGGPELARANIEMPEDFIGLFVVGWDELAKHTGKGPLNTDDNAMIEFGAPRDLLTYSHADAHLPFVEDIEGQRLALAGRYFRGFDVQDPSVLATVAARLVRQGRIADTDAVLERAKSLNTQDLAVRSSLQRTKQILERLTESASEAVIIDAPETRDDERYARVAWTMIDGKEERAMDLADRPDGFEKISSAHGLLYAYLCYRFDRYVDAQYLIDRVLDDRAFADAHPAVRYYAAQIYAARGKYGKAVEHIEAFLDAPAR